MVSGSLSKAYLSSLSVAGSGEWWEASVASLSLELSSRNDLYIVLYLCPGGTGEILCYLRDTSSVPTLVQFCYVQHPLPAYSIFSIYHSGIRHKKIKSSFRSLSPFLKKKKLSLFFHTKVIYNILSSTFSVNLYEDLVCQSCSVYQAWFKLYLTSIITGVVGLCIKG